MRLSRLFLASSALLLVLSACNRTKEPVIGGDKDANGCIGSAGYTWCEPKQKCLRVFEEKCFASDQQEIQYAIAKLIGKKTNEFSVSITKQEGNYARGNISFGPDAPGGMYLAQKSENAWEIVYQGNGSVNCEDLAQRKFPEELLEGFCE